MKNTCFNSTASQFPYVIDIFVTILCNYLKDAHQPVLAQTYFLLSLHYRNLLVLSSLFLEPVTQMIYIMHLL